MYLPGILKINTQSHMTLEEICCLMSIAAVAISMATMAPKQENSKTKRRPWNQKQRLVD